MYLEVLVIVEHLDKYTILPLLKNDSKIIFEYDSLAIFAGNTQKYSYPPPSPYIIYSVFLDSRKSVKHTTNNICIYIINIYNIYSFQRLVNIVK